MARYSAFSSTDSVPFVVSRDSVARSFHVSRSRRSVRRRKRPFNDLFSQETGEGTDTQSTLSSAMRSGDCRCGLWEEADAIR